MPQGIVFAKPGGLSKEGSSSRRPDIQGLRAVAVIMVVAFHTGLPAYGGFVGVDVFFVVSGFVITAMLQREWQSKGEINLRRFYFRRFKRLTPALAVTIAVTLLFSSLFFSPFGSQQTSAITGLGAILVTANFVIARTTGDYFAAPAELNPLLHTWSLSVEEQFYLAFPALLILSWMIARRGGLLRFSPVLGVSAIGALSFSLAMAGAAAMSFPGSSLLLGFYSPLTRAWEFAAGALICLALTKQKPLSRSFANMSGIIGLGMLLASTLLIDKATVFPGPWTLLPVAGTLLLLAAGTCREAISNRVLGAKPMVKIGDWSYSIYLWHWPFIVFSKHLWPESSWVIVAAATLSLAPAIASFYLVERPIRLLEPLTLRRKKRLMLAIFLPPVVASIALYSVAELWLAPGVESGTIGTVVNEGDIGHVTIHQFVEGQYFPCSPRNIRENALYWDGFLRCQQSKRPAPVEVALVGDSHAEHLFLGLAEAYPDTNFAYYILGELPVRSSGKEMAVIIDEVVQDPTIRAVVLTAFWAARGVPESELAETIRELHESGKSVFVTDDIPSFPFDPIQCRSQFGIFASGTRCEISAEDNGKIYSGFIESLRGAVSQVPGARLLESNKFLCGPEYCSMALDGELLYRDGNHLNMNGTRFLAKQLVSANPDLRRALSGQ